MQPARPTVGRFVGALLLVALAMSFLACPATCAAPKAPLPSDDALRPEDAALRELITQLDADTLQTRQQASEQLLSAGERAISPLVAALPHASAETTLRGLAVLKKLAQSDDHATKLKARGALEQLARSEDQSLATQAAGILKTQDPTPRSNFRGPGQMVGIQGGLRMVQIQMMNGPAVRRIIARENGQTVTISESRERGISVTFTERVKGQERSTTVAANTVDDLDRKNPQAAALYRRYARGAGGLGGNRLIAPGMIAPREPVRLFERPQPEPQLQKP